jgi:hypothetical protein
MKLTCLLVVGAALALGACATAASAPGRGGSAAAAITAHDLRRDLFFLSSDSMRGRLGATEDELRASAWLAEQARRIGMEPAGDDGTYFQFFPLRRFRLSGESTVSVGGRPLRLWRDVVVMGPVDARVDAPVMVADGALIPTGGAAGRVVVAALRQPPNPPPADVSLREYRYTASAVAAQRNVLSAATPAAIVLVADSVGLMAFDNMVKFQRQGRYLLDTAGVNPRAGVSPIPVFLVRPGVIPANTEGLRLTADLRTESFVYPSVNVVARVPGTDPSLRGEHVVFSGHQDHDGVHHPVNGDSIWNGADDNATVSVALLAIGRAFVRQPGRRSALFVWHGAEERGLLGSNWYARTPTVPKASLVAVLNGDMIGRNHPDSAALLGMIPPHRNSTALVEMAMAANPGFAVDSTWDAPSHPEGWYFRSDHLPYARAGIPAIFFTTLLHADYHTPEDEPERIDIAKLERMTRWMYGTGWAVANAPQRPTVDPGFRLER